ncbi:MAG: VOC family protein [Syntrophaceae bacterium]|nr:VOC family protein [Syntrophaceae bacterium]
MAKTVAHICILVADIDRAIADYIKIFEVVSPGLVERKVVKQERWAANEKYITAFFGAASDACEIQLIQAPDERSPLYKRLVAHGEGVHHIAFVSPRLKDTYRRLKEKDIAVNRGLIDERPHGHDASDLRHFWIRPRATHGVLIEMIDDYGLQDGLLAKE